MLSRQVPLFGMMKELAPDNLRGSAIAQNTFLMIGGLFNPLVLSMTHLHHTRWHIHGEALVHSDYSFALALFPALTLLAIILTAWIQPPNRDTSPSIT